MKKLHIILLVLVGLLVASCSGGGGSDGGGGGGGGGTGDFSTGGGTAERIAIDAYLNEFLLPTLVSLDVSAATLLSASQNFASSPSDATLQSARQAWVASRIPWEKSETALFGPVDFNGFDPALDTWPVNQADLEAVLRGGSPLTESTVSNLDNALKGYHTIEYLIYGNDGSKQASDLTSREGEYLVAAASELKSVTANLLAAWVDGFGGEPAFALEVVNAGQGSAVFPSESSAIEQFVRGIIVICDEVANGKIADPFDQRNPNIVESQFSGNSLADFANNISGAKQAYTASISSLVSAQDPALDARIRSAFDTAITSIRAIPEPFLQAIQNSRNDGVITTAQRNIREVQTLMERDVLPIILG